MQSRIRKKETANLPTEYGNFKAIVYECTEGLHHVALVTENNAAPVTGDDVTSAGNRASNEVEAVEAGTPLDTDLVS